MAPRFAELARKVIEADVGSVTVALYWDTILKKHSVQKTTVVEVGRCDDLKEAKQIMADEVSLIDGSTDA